MCDVCVCVGDDMEVIGEMKQVIDKIRFFLQKKKKKAERAIKRTDPPTRPRVYD